MSAVATAPSAAPPVAPPVAPPAAPPASPSRKPVTIFSAGVSRKPFTIALQAVQRAISNRSALPVLTHVKIATDGADDALVLSCTDLEVGITSRIPCEVNTPGGITVPAKALLDLVSRLPEKADIQISADSAHSCEIVCGRSKYRILGLPVEECPELPPTTNPVTMKISQGLLRALFRHVIFAASQDTTKAILTGVYMAPHQYHPSGTTVLRTVATDSHRLAFAEGNVQSLNGAGTTVLPGRCVKELVGLLTDGDGDVEIELTRSQVSFKLPGDDNLTVVTRCIEGDYPNFGKVIQAIKGSTTTRIKTDDMLHAVDRALIVADSSRVVLEPKEERMQITAQGATVGAGEESIDCIIDGEAVQAAFNGKYLLDVLRVMQQPSLQMEFCGSLKPAIMRPHAEEKVFDYLCVVMPMQMV